MASMQIKQTPENRNTKRTSVSISGPAHMVSVGSAPRGSKAKSEKATIEECRITPRYLRPPVGSCHDLCKHGLKDESLELRVPTRGLGSRKMSVVKNEGVKRTVVPVERNKITETKPKRYPDPKILAPDKPVQVIKRGNSLPSKKTGISKHSLSTDGKSTQNELKMAKDQVKTKPVSSIRLNGQRNKKENKKIAEKVQEPLKDQYMMTKTKLKKLIAAKVQEMAEMTLHEAETTEVELVPPTVEIIQTSSIQTTEPTNISESSESFSDKQVSNLGSEHVDDEEVLEEKEGEYDNNEEVIISEDDYEMETSEGNYNYRVVICEDKENGGFKVKFRRGRVVELESEDDGPKRLKFKRGKVLEDNGDGQSTERVNFKKKSVEDTINDCDSCSETVTLKHQEVQKRKEAQELLNRVIEETASKLVEDRKTKVGALVGAFETVISLQDDKPSSE